MRETLRKLTNPRRYLPAAQFLFQSVGRPWREFYAWMIDRQERRNSIEKIRSWKPDVEGYERGFFDLTRGSYHRDFMIRHGLKPTHKVLDFGCGFGRTAAALVPFLEPGNYTGVDLSHHRLRMAQDWIKELNLESRRPRFLRSTDIKLSYLPDESVDVIWTQAVISHMPLEDVQEFFRSATRVLRSDGMILFDYVISRDGYNRPSIKDFFYTENTIAEVLASAGFSAQHLGDWDDDIPPEKRVPNEILMKATLK